LVFLCLALVAPPGLVAFPSSPAQFTSTYPGTAGTKLDSCSTCHTTASGGPLNPYGAAVGAANFNYASIEGQDSDNDGFINIDEINAITFPGDATDFPDDPGGCDPDDPDCCDPDDPDCCDPDDPDCGEPEGRIHDRMTLAEVVDAYSAALGSAENRDIALVGYSARVRAARGSRATDGVFGQPVSSEGEPAGEPLALDDLSNGRVLAVEYDGLRNLLVTWTGGGSGILGQTFNARNGRPRGDAARLASGSAADVVWDPAIERFLLASSSGGGVSMTYLSRRGRVESRLPYALGVTDVIGFAGLSSLGAVLVATEGNFSGDRPIGVLLENGNPGAFSLGYRDYSEAAQRTVSALGGNDLGLVAMDVAGSVSLGMMGADGALLGVAEPQSNILAGRMAVAAQADGSFLLFWIDPDARKLMGADVGADGKVIGEFFEVQDVDEVVDSDVLAAEAFAGEVMVVYATTGATPQVRSVFVNVR
jgi:hypothetical protein